MPVSLGFTDSLCVLQSCLHPAVFSSLPASVESKSGASQEEGRGVEPRRE